MRRDKVEPVCLVHGHFLGMLGERTWVLARQKCGKSVCLQTWPLQPLLQVGSGGPSRFAPVKEACAESCARAD